MVNIPEGATCTRDTNGTTATVKHSKWCEEFRIYYRTSDMFFPDLLYAEDPAYPNEVAVCASLVPTFEPPQP